MPLPCRRSGARRTSARARWPVTMAAMLPSQGSTLQPRMPHTRLATARPLVWRMGVLMGGTPGDSRTGAWRVSGAQAAVAQGVGPVVEATLPRPPDGRAGIVVDGQQLNSPAAAVAVQHRISRGTRPALHHVRMRLAAAEGRQADAA